MTNDQIIAVLERCRFFQGLDAGALVRAAAAARERHAPAEGFFFHQGDPATAFYVLSAGHARMVQATPEGQQIILGLAGPHQEVGIIAAIEGAEYPLALQAVQECSALVWERPALLSLIEQQPVLALRALRMVSGRFVELQQRYRELATERVERRVARALLRLTEQVGRPEPGGIALAVPLARQDLAEMTGTTLYTVSRILSAWEQRGIVSTGRERVALRDPAALARIADDLPES